MTEQMKRIRRVKVDGIDKDGDILPVDRTIALS